MGAIGASAQLGHANIPGDRAYFYAELSSQVFAVTRTYPWMDGQAELAWIV